MTSLPLQPKRQFAKSLAIIFGLVRLGVCFSVKPFSGSQTLGEVAVVVVVVVVVVGGGWREGEGEGGKNSCKTNGEAAVDEFQGGCSYLPYAGN